MHFTLKFQMDNDAFKVFDQGNPEHGEPDISEIQRILRNVNRSMSDGYHGNTIKDSNGNTVGSWGIEADVNDPEYIDQ